MPAFSLIMYIPLQYPLHEFVAYSSGQQAEGFEIHVKSHLVNSHCLGQETRFMPGEQWRIPGQPGNCFVCLFAKLL